MAVDFIQLCGAFLDAMLSLKIPAQLMSDMTQYANNSPSACQKLSIFSQLPLCLFHTIALALACIN